MMGGRVLPGAVMLDEVMIGTESAGGWEFVGGQEFTLLYALCINAQVCVSRSAVNPYLWSLRWSCLLKAL